ncbi:AAA family ATPase [Solirubrobacter soli]|uniref:AAA family ATPase n=1 Tax=Solirubrobacter soli TaxID=363832 RepID=UPI00069E7E15|nr:AAA family ATPase [Solirubrobacter soli]
MTAVMAPDELDGLVALAPVKTRVREITALLTVDRMRAQAGLAATRPTLHMCFIGNPGTGKTTVALRMAAILFRLGYVENPRVVSVTRDDLVGQWVGHTAPKTRAVLDRAAGGVLFIDEAYYLHRPENERDYGQEAIEILLQAMENDRDRLVVILAGYRERMEQFFASNPGMRSRVAHHVEFPDYSEDDLLEIARRMVAERDYELGEGALDGLELDRSANARAVRNAVDRARLRHAARVVDLVDPTREDLMTLAAEDFAP